MGSLTPEGSDDYFEQNLNSESGPIIKSLEDLKSHLHHVFKSDDINVEMLERLMKAYQNEPTEWRKYAHFDAEKLTRNLVDTGNGKYNLILVCWEGGHQSTIHDHANCHCFMRQLEGALTEIRYAWPDKDAGDDSPMKEISRFTLNTPEVSYINDSIGLHRMENASPSNRAVSLHLYCPPINACKVFSKDSGKSIKCPVTFWSKYGQKSET